MNQRLEKATSNFTLIFISQDTVSHLIESSEWNQMKLLVKYRCQYKANEKSSVRSLRLSDFLAQTFKLEYSIKERVNTIVALQKRMDFDNLALVLVKNDKIHWRETGETIFPLLSDKRLRIKQRDEAIVELLKAAFFQDRFDLAIKIWNTYATVITN